MADKTVRVHDKESDQDIPVNLHDNGDDTYSQEVFSKAEGNQADAAQTDSTQTGSLLSFVKGLVKILNDSWDSVSHGLKVLQIGGTSNLVDSIAASPSTDVVMDGNEPLTPQFAVINRATNADGAAVVNLVANKKIRVLKLSMTPASAVGAKWQSGTTNTTGTGSNTDLSAVETLPNTPYIEPFTQVGIFETKVGESLKLNLNAGVQVSGKLTYVTL